MISTAPATGRHVTAAGSDIGDVIDGHRIVKRLRVRGCSAIYRAETGSGVQVVLKTLCVGGPKRVQARFDNEIGMLRLLNGEPVVPRLVASGTVGEQRYLAAEWRSGRTLRRLARRTRDEAPEDAARWFPAMAVSVCRAVERLHARSVAHGDISRRNILVLPCAAAASLIDLESARRLGEDDALRRKTTWAYAPPEFADDHRPTPESDQYGVAAVLFRQLTRRRHRPPPMDGVAPDSAEALGAPVRPLDGWAHHRWPELGRVFATALALDPADRYPSLAGFIAHLSTACAADLPTTDTYPTA